MPYVPPTTHVTLFATVQRERLLPMPGEVLVREGQRVEATDVVARAQIASAHRLLDIAHQLGLPPDKTDQYLVMSGGDKVKKGDTLAVRKMALGLMPKRVTSPVDGLLVAAGEGKALLAVIPQPFEVRAGFPGTVTHITERRGVTIETAAALVEGAWGNTLANSLTAKEDFAVMRVVGSSPRNPLAPEQVDVSLRGTILAVGILQSEAALKKLAEVHVRGLIVGSAKADLLPMLLKLEIPAIITDGLGGQGFSPAAFALFVSNTGREAWISARAWDRFTGRRPEVLIPLPSPGQTPPNLASGGALSAGKRVRITRGPQAGRVGKVAALSEHSAVLPSGVRARVATIEFDQREDPAVEVPFANLEIIR